MSTDKAAGSRNANMRLRSGRVKRNENTSKDQQWLTEEEMDGKRRNETSEKGWQQRHDVIAWSGGMAFIAVLMGAMFGIGSHRGWDANSGYTHNFSNTSRHRFLPEPFEPENGVIGRYGVEADSRWYYWKLPPDQVTPYTRMFMWLAYVGHQLLVWAVTYVAQQEKARNIRSPKYTAKLTKWNWVSLGLNMFFYLLHLLQTHVTYDALAQDVSIASSQGSVIMLLIMIILMEYKDRGLFFGWPSKDDTGSISQKMRLSCVPVNLMRRYHGYAFAWASIYTFWYHPMENTWGHCFGFLHTWMIMLQGCLMHTHFHRNRYWRLVLEIWVTIHAGVVAFQTSGPEQLGTKLWPMFVFGFVFIIVVTQIFSLPFWKKIHWLFRFIPLVIYIPVVLYMYSWIPDEQGRTWIRMAEVLRIPATYYLFFLFSWFLLFAFLKIEKSIGNDAEKINWKKQACFLTLTMAIYAVLVGISAAVQIYDVQIGLIVLMIIFVAVFIVGACVSVMLLKNTFVVNAMQTGRRDDKDANQTLTASSD